jgi:cyclic pyranopterin phosphate synthase
MSEFTHIDGLGRVRMVDVSDKEATRRSAIASGRIFMKSETLDLIVNNSLKKGNVLETARIAGIMAVKKTSDLIPMCHPIQIRHAAVDFFPDPQPERSSIRVQCSVRVVDQTGVEMEAMTAVSLACLTIYDMCKSYDRGMTIGHIGLVEKSGGKSGTYMRPLTELEK